MKRGGKPDSRTNVIARAIKFTGAALVAGIAVWLLVREARQPSETNLETKAPASLSPVAGQGPVVAEAEPASIDASPPPDAPEESRTARAGTVRMLAAHASLRAPEVADPDSVGNRKILETMITKALIRTQRATITP